MALPEQIYHDLIILIEASETLSDLQKENIHKKIPELSDRQIYQLVEALKKEQKILAEYYHDVAQIHKHAAEKKIKAIYHSTEDMVGLVEKNEINALEQELETLEV